MTDNQLRNTKGACITPYPDVIIAHWDQDAEITGAYIYCTEDEFVIEWSDGY